MSQSFKNVLFFILGLRCIIVFVALLNFIWFFIRSKAVVEFGSDMLSFCGSCAWYYEGELVKLPLVLLLASLFLLPDRWWGYLIAIVISGYETINGVVWVSRIDGFFSGLVARVEFVLTNVEVEIWKMLHWQYLFALVICGVSMSYLVAKIIKFKRNQLKL